MSIFTTADLWKFLPSKALPRNIRVDIGISGQRATAGSYLSMGAHGPERAARRPRGRNQSAKPVVEAADQRGGDRCKSRFTSFTNGKLIPRT